MQLLSVFKPGLVQNLARCESPNSCAIKKRVPLPISYTVCYQMPWWHRGRPEHPVLTKPFNNSNHHNHPTQHIQFTILLATQIKKIPFDTLTITIHTKYHKLRAKINSKCHWARVQRKVRKTICKSMRLFVFIFLSICLFTIILIKYPFLC